MTGPDDLPSAAEDPLADAHDRLLGDLGALLDVEAGLRDAMVAARHTDLERDLRSVLDIDAGLQAIVAPAPRRPGAGTDVAGYGQSDALAPERHAREEGQLVMPFYLVCDVSYSMREYMAALNEGIARLHRAIVNQPAVDDVVQLSVISFSNTAEVLVPLEQLSEMPAIPALASEGGTNYGSAFRVLAQSIARDSARLKGDGYRIYRPCAFFLTDGAPGDADWQHTFASTLTYEAQASRGMREHPIFVPFGLREAPESVLKQLAYPPERSKWYRAGNASIDQAIVEIVQIIMKTVVTAGSSAMRGQPSITLQSPAPDSGIIRGDSAYDPDSH
jgi:uncharacterized protein YegL